MKSAKAQKLARIIGLHIGIFAAVTLYVCVISKLGISCFFSAATGLPCPGCGLTRAGLALLRGDVVLSLRYHPFLVPLVAILLAGPHARLLHIPQKPFTVFCVVTGILVFAFWIFRLATGWLP